MIDRTQPWYWLNESSREFMSRGYTLPGQTPEERVQQIADFAEKTLNRPGYSKKLVEYVSRGWISFSTPVWANFGLGRGLPISCFGSYLADDMSSIMFTHAENGMMSKYGGGTSGYFGALRPRGTEIKDNGSSNGPVHFMQMFEKLIQVVSQGKVRRGSFSPYLPVEHPDIMEFLEIGTEGNAIQNMTHGVTVTNAWLKEMTEGDEEKRKIWAKVIQRRGEIGYPYILFTDNANDNKPQVYKDKDMKIVASNLCSEIMLPSDEENSFVCCLSSLNVLHYDEWKDTDLVEVMIALLDSVITDFCHRLETLRDADDRADNQAFYFMERAYNFAKNHRALGLGVLGWHSYLQSKGIPFESMEAGKLNVEIWKNMKEKGEQATKQLALELGEPEVLKGYGRRNTTLFAIAPTTSSAFILGQVSQSIEPVWSNNYVKDLAKLKVTIHNPFLEDLLEKKGKNTKDIWNSIRDHDGSVQHLEFFTDTEKDVFRTFAELDQAVIIEQAAVRQLYIDQGQSLNIMVSPSVEIKEVNQLYLMAARKGIKALYYQHSMNAAQALTRQKICIACEA
jgi:ribonucleoside-diphosphate reductase alpha chain